MMLRHHVLYRATYRFHSKKASCTPVWIGYRCVRLFSWTTIVLPTITFTGLLSALWIYKCLVMIILQNKIIYMPSLPPFSRREKISDYRYPKGVYWKEEQFRSIDGTKLSVASGEVEKLRDNKSLIRRRNIIVYFQGNGSSLPPRLPSLSRVLLKTCSLQNPEHSCVLVALSYRGYWTSSGKPSQVGLEKDALSCLQWIMTREEAATVPTSVILWGQSLGAAVAITTAATALEQRRYRTEWNKMLSIKGIILETPFTSIKHMLLDLYPQRWLPYRYLHPFLWNHWDSVAAVKRLGTQISVEPPSILLVQAGKDELVARSHAVAIRAAMDSHNLKHSFVRVPNAFHTNAADQEVGRDKISEFIQRVLYE